MNFDDVVRLSRDLPGIELGTSFGTPALRVRRKFMCRVREDNETLVLTPIDEIQQRFLMETQRDVFYKTPHYEAHASILIHLSRVSEAALSQLLEETWRRLAPKRLLTGHEYFKTPTLSMPSVVRLLRGICCQLLWNASWASLAGPSF
jgi:hypothetical protein